MSKGAAKLPLDGSELLDLINSANTKNAAYGSLSDVADYINSLGIPSEVVMIALLQDISKKLDCLPMLLEQQILNNEYIKEIID